MKQKCEKTLPPRKPLIVGIAGKKRHGKDTLASYLTTALKGYKVVRLGFADALKAEVAKATECPVSFIEANKDAFRPILQWWGTDFRRTFQTPDYWLCKFEAKLPTNVNFILVPDVRFENEAKLIESLGGVVIHVERTGYSDDGDTHVSENDLKFYGFDYYVTAEKKSALKQQAKKLANIFTASKTHKTLWFRSNPAVTHSLLSKLEKLSPPSRVKRGTTHHHD